MSALAAAVTSSNPSRALPRASERPTCRVCADTMIAAEASVLTADGVVSYLWACDTCGYGFVTSHALRYPRCN
jgi:hypothetical protein